MLCSEFRNNAIGIARYLTPNTALVYQTFNLDYYQSRYGAYMFVEAVFSRILKMLKSHI